MKLRKIHFKINDKRGDDFMRRFSEKEYFFLREDDRFTSERLALLTYGGSHAYGTNKEGSDVDWYTISTVSGISCRTR